MFKSHKSLLTASLAVLVTGAFAAQGLAVDLTSNVRNADMNYAQQASTTGFVLKEGQDAYVNTNTVNNTTERDGWRLWAGGSGGGSQYRLWNPSSTDTWTNGNNEWFDHSWGGLDGQGDANGSVIAVHTQTWDYIGSSTNVDTYGNRTWATPLTNVATTGSVYPTGTYDWATDGGNVRDLEAAAQQLSIALEANTKYVLSVRVGRLATTGLNAAGTTLPGTDGILGTVDDVAGTSTRWVNAATPADFNGYFVDLMAGGVTDLSGNFGGWVYGTTANVGDADYIGTLGTQAGDDTSISADSWITSTVTYTPNTAGNALVGKNLVIRLGANELANHQNTAAVAFDDVQLKKFVAGDANSDDKVDLNDASAVISNWAATTGKTWNQGDFTGDGAVNLNDASLLISHWGEDYTGAAPEVVLAAAVGDASAPLLVI